MGGSGSKSAEVVEKIVQVVVPDKAQAELLEAFRTRCAEAEAALRATMTALGNAQEKLFFESSNAKRLKEIVDKQRRILVLGGSGLVLLSIGWKLKRIYNRRVEPRLRAVMAPHSASAEVLFNLVRQGVPAYDLPRMLLFATAGSPQAGKSSLLCLMDSVLRDEVILSTRFASGGSAAVGAATGHNTVRDGVIADLAIALRDARGVNVSTDAQTLNTDIYDRLMSGAAVRRPANAPPLTVEELTPSVVIVVVTAQSLLESALNPALLDTARQILHFVPNQMKKYGGAAFAPGTQPRVMLLITKADEVKGAQMNDLRRQRHAKPLADLFRIARESLGVSENFVFVLGWLNKNLPNAADSNDARVLTVRAVLRCAALLGRERFIS